MAIFTLNCNSKLIYVLVYWIFEIFIRLLMYMKGEYFSITNIPIENEYLFIIYPVISKLLCGFLIIYLKCVSFKKNDKIKKQKMHLIYINPIEKKTKYYYFKLLFITILELLSCSFYFIFYLIFDTNEVELSKKVSKDIITLLDILVRYIFSIVILKMKTFKHHKFSIWAILTGLILIVPFDICDVYYKENSGYTFIFIGIYSLKSITFPLECTYIKKFFNDYYILPEYLIFSISVIETILLAILTPFLYSTNVLKFELSLSSEVIIMILVYILTTAVREYILMKIIYLFSSQSVSFLIISQLISGLLKDIINFINPKDDSEIPLYVYLSFPFELITIIIIIIATLVYDEILIINKWGLNSNVKKRIIERASKDIQSTSIELIEHINSFDEMHDTNCIDSNPN